MTCIERSMFLPDTNHTVRLKREVAASGEVCWDMAVEELGEEIRWIYNIDPFSVIKALGRLEEIVKEEAIKDGQG